MVKDVCPLLWAGQECTLSLLLPPNVEIKDDHLNVCPSQARSSSCGEACHTQTSCFSWSFLLAWTSCHNLFRATVLPHQIINDFGPLCISTKWLFHLFLVKRTLSNGNLTIIPFTTTRLFGISPSSLLFPSIFPSSSSSSASSSSYSFSSSFRRFGRPPGSPSSPAVAYGTGIGMYGPCSKIMTCLKSFTSYKILTGFTWLWYSDVCHSDRTWRNNI